MVIPALSSLSPVSLTYGLDQNMVLNGTTIHFDSGLSLYCLDALGGYVDIVINKDNLLFLTESLNLSEVATITGDDEVLPEEYIGSSTFALSGRDGLYWDTTQDVLGTEDEEIIQTQDLFFIRLPGSGSLSATDSSVIFYIDVTDGLMSIHDSFDQYLTFVPSTMSITFSAQMTPDTYNYQHFNYLIDGENIMLFTAVAALSAQRTIYYNTIAGVLSAGPAISITNPITTNHVFVLGSFGNSGINDFAAVQSNWIVYDDKDQSVSVEDRKSIAATEHAFLLSTPYKALSGDSLDVNLNNLKNYQTPEYGYIRNVNGPYGRDYNKIIAGVNQEDGYENLFLTFDGDTQELLLGKDKYTYFHYSPTATTHSLSASTLVNSGAIAGNTPWRSDKVFKKQADYKKYSNWGDASVQNGTWFCSWLSGSEDPYASPTWMDRYFDPTYAVAATTSLQYALLTAIDNDLVNTAGNPVIWDIPSALTFEPGVLYIYHHLGETRNAEIVTNLESGRDLLLKYISWGSTDSDVIVDETGTYNGEIVGFELSANNVDIPNITNVAYNVNETLGFVDGIDAIFAKDELTFSFIVNVNDWQNVVGDQILGNYYNGGFGVFNNNPILTPYFTMYDSVSGYVYNLSTNYQVLNKTNFIPHNGGRPNIITKAGRDADYYIVDNSQNILAYDIENVLQDLIPLSTIIGGISATQLELDGEGNFHIMDAVTHTYYKVSNTGTLLTTTSAGVADRFALDFDGVIHFPVVGGVIAATVNSTNDLFYITSSHLYRNNTIVWQASSLEGLLCDDHDNLWLTYNKNSVAKLDSNNALVLKADTPVQSAAIGKRSLSFVKELNSEGLDEYLILFDNRTKYAHKLTTDGTFTSSTPLSGFTGSLLPLSAMQLNGIADNGFEYQRKFVAPTLTLPGVSVKAYLGEQFVNGGSTSIHIQASTEDLHGPQHFAVAFNYANGTVKLYIGGKLVASDMYDAFKYKIVSNQNILSLVIGSNAGKRDIFVNELHQPGYYTLAGAIADFRIFGKELNHWDIKALGENSKTIAFKNLTWNMPVGSRNYVEEIERFFKHKMPGNKSQFFNIKLTGLSITDTAVRELIEESIKSVLTRINPVHATLYNIIWE